MHTISKSLEQKYFYAYQTQRLIPTRKMKTTEEYCRMHVYLFFFCLPVGGQLGRWCSLSKYYYVSSLSNGGACTMQCTPCIFIYNNLNCCCRENYHHIKTTSKSNKIIMIYGLRTAIAGVGADASKCCWQRTKTLFEQHIMEKMFCEHEQHFTLVCMHTWSLRSYQAMKCESTPEFYISIVEDLRMSECARREWDG